jgi:peptidoglycan/LPS O-acetylase OafA/YrhL
MTILWITLFHFYIDTRGAAVAGPGRFAAAIERADPAGAVAVAMHALAGLPSFRVDVFLFVSGLALALGRPLPPGTFYRRRARAVLPDYWLGSLAAFLVLVASAALRATFLGGPFPDELHHGSRLAHGPYVFEWPDLVRSASVLGRFASARAMQVVSPSLWYVVLLGQLYLVFPLLRWALRRVGPGWFLAAAAAITWGARGAAFRHAFVPGFDAVQTVICFIPFRLLAPAAGMVVARWAGSLARPPRRAPLWLLSPFAVSGLVVSVWAGADMNTPGTWTGVLGGSLPVAISLPALWVLAWLATPTTVGGLLTWAGRHSLSLLVVQDFLRFGVGTLLVARGDLADLTWPMAPFYVALALLVTRLWHPLPRAAADRLCPAPATGRRAGGHHPEGA